MPRGIEVVSPDLHTVNHPEMDRLSNRMERHLNIDPQMEEGHTRAIAVKHSARMGWKPGIADEAVTRYIWHRQYQLEAEVWADDQVKLKRKTEAIRQSEEGYSLARREVEASDAAGDIPTKIAAMKREWMWWQRWAVLTRKGGPPPFRMPVARERPLPGEEAVPPRRRREAPAERPPWEVIMEQYEEDLRQKRGS